MLKGLLIFVVIILVVVSVIGSSVTQQATTSEDGRVIRDNRRPTERNRKIISEDEGEYVEFTEE